MPDYLQDAQTWLAGKFKSHMTSSATLVRGVNSITILATIAPKAYQIFNQYGIPEVYISWDFIVTSADYKPAGTVVEPERGDRFEYGGRKYEVLPVPGEGSFKYCDALKKQIRIHTKDVGATA